METNSDNNGFYTDGFSEIIDRLRQNSQAKAQAVMDEQQLIDFLVKAKEEAESKLQSTIQNHNKIIDSVKAKALSQVNTITKQVNSLRQQLRQQKQEYVSKIQQLTENANYNTAQYENIITKLKIESSEKIKQSEAEAVKNKAAITYELQALKQRNIQIKQQYEDKVNTLTLQTNQRLKIQADELTNAKSELVNLRKQIVNEQKARMRADELNNRLAEQCMMAKNGADTEIEMRTKDFAEKIAQIKTESTLQIKSHADKSSLLKTKAQNVINKLKNDSQYRETRYAEELKLAKARIKLLEETINRMRMAPTLSY